MLKSRLTNQRGITLLELLAALAIFAVIGSIMFSLLINAYQSFNIGSTQSNLMKETQLIEIKLKQTVRNSAFFDELPDEENAFIFYSSSSAPDVIFRFENNSLLMEQAATTTELSSNVSNFSLEKQGRQILYSIEMLKDDQSLEISGSGSVFMPNWRD